MEHKKKDWRKEKQNENVWREIKIIGNSLNILGVAVFITTMIFGRISLFWFISCCLVTLISLTIYFIFPQYFTLMEEHTFKRKRINSKVIFLEIAVSFPMCALILRSLIDFHIISWMPLIVYAFVGGTLFSFLVYILSREARENKGMLLGLTLLSIVIFGAITTQINHFANIVPEPAQMCKIIELDSHRYSRRKFTLYNCDVELQSGEKIRLPISRKQHSELKPGDDVLSYRGRGFLGIEYAYYVGKTSEA